MNFLYEEKVIATTTIHSFLRKVVARTATVVFVGHPAIEATLNFHPASIDVAVVKMPIELPIQGLGPQCELCTGKWHDDTGNLLPSSNNLKKYS